MVRSNSRKLRTAWHDIVDSHCGVYPPQHAPLDCRVQYNIEVAPLSQLSSSFQISYQERCINLKGRGLRCPDSNAERLMLSIVNELKRRGGVIDEPQ